MSDDRMYPLQEFTPEECAKYTQIMCAPAAPESYVPPACTVYSHSADGWHCSETGPHEVHRNAAGDVTWQ